MRILKLLFMSLSCFAFSFAPTPKFNPLDTEFSMLRVRSFLKPEEISRLLPADQAILKQNLPDYKKALKVIMVRRAPYPCLPSEIFYEVSFANSSYCLSFEVGKDSMHKIFMDVEVTERDKQSFLSGQSHLKEDECIFQRQRKYGGDLVIKILRPTDIYYFILRDFEIIPNFNKVDLYNEMHSFREYIKKSLPFINAEEFKKRFETTVHNASFSRFRRHVEEISATFAQQLETDSSTKLLVSM